MLHLWVEGQLLISDLMPWDDRLHDGFPIGVESSSLGYMNNTAGTYGMLELSRDDWLGSVSSWSLLSNNEVSFTE